MVEEFTRKSFLDTI